MRENGLPKVLAWRWTPCAAFVLGSVSFAAFMLLAIPDHIGPLPKEATSDSLRFQLARTQSTPTPQSDWSSHDTTNTVAATPSPVDRTVARNNDVTAFPKRGFSPPLERAEPDPPPAPPSVLPTPIPPQPQLNVPPPVPAPVEQAPAAAPPQPEAFPPAVPASPPPDAQSPQPPAPSSN